MDRKLYDNLFYDNWVDFERVGAEKGYHPDDDFEKIEELIAEDLEDKDFSDSEIEEIVYSKNPDSKTAYKFVAYMLLLYNDYETIDELRYLCEEKGLLDDLTDEDLENILMQRNEVDY